MKAFHVKHSQETRRGATQGRERMKAMRKSSLWPGMLSGEQFFVEAIELLDGMKM